MVTEVSSKQQLETLASELRTKSSQLSSDISSIMSMLNGVSDYDGINITQAANTLANNLQSIMSSLNGVITGISSYASQVSATDVYGLNSGSTSTNPVVDNTTSPNNGVIPGTTNGNSGSTGTPTGTTGNTGTNNGYTGGTGSNGSGGSTGSHNTGGSNGSSNGGSSAGAGFAAGVGAGLGAGAATGGGSTGSRPTGGGSTGGQTTGGGTTGSTETQTSGQRAEKVVISTGDKDYQMLGEYSNNPEMGFNVTTGNLKYELTEKDFDLLCAMVASEGDLSYDESMAVVTSILNRCDNSEFISLYGKDPIAQITALNQYTSYSNGAYKSFLNGKAPTEVVNAVKDALNGVRSHSYCSYKANSFTDFSGNMITSSGNRYK